MKREQHYSWTLSLTILIFTSMLNGCGQSNIQPDDYQPEKAAKNNLELGIEYIHRGEYDVAMRRLKKALVQEPNYADAHNTIAALYEHLGQNVQAKQHYEKAIALKPMGSNINNNYGQFLCKRGEWEIADQLFMRAIEDPLYKTPEIPYTNAGVCAFAHEAFNKAEGYFRKALKLRRNLPKALFQMALLSYAIKRHGVAHDYLKRYLDILEHSPRSLWLGIRIARALNDKNTESSYAMLLRFKFPDAEEVQSLNASELP